MTAMSLSTLETLKKGVSIITGYPIIRLIQIPTEHHPVIPNKNQQHHHIAKFHDRLPEIIVDTHLAYTRSQRH